MSSASSSSASAPTSASAVQVALRIRPLNKRELSSASQVCCRVDGSNGVVLLPPVGRVSRRSTAPAGSMGTVSRDSSITEKQLFNFDYVYGDGPSISIDNESFERNSQERVFRELGHIILQNAFAGFNCSLLAYGQTGAGKCFAGHVELIRADGSLVRADAVIDGDELMGDDGTPRRVIANTLTRGKAPLLRIISSNPEHKRELVVNIEHILVLYVPHTVTPVIANESADGFQFTTFALNSFNTLQCHLHSYSSLSAAHLAHMHAVAASSSSSFIWEVSVRRFLNLHLISSPTNPLVDPQAFNPHHHLFVSAQARAACRLYTSTAGTLRTALQQVGIHSATQSDLDELAYVLGLAVAATHSISDPTRNSDILACLNKWAATQHLHQTFQPTDNWQQRLAQLSAPGSALHHLLHSLNHSTAPSSLLFSDCTSTRSHFAGLHDGGHTSASPSTLTSSFTLTKCPTDLDFDIHTSAFTLEPWMDGEPQPYFGFAVDGNRRFLTADHIVTHNSHTMMGYAPERTLATDMSVDTNGLIPRLCTSLFARCAKESSEDSSMSFKVNVSYLEVYAEKIQDLLDKSKRNLQVRQHPKNGPYVDGLSIMPVSNYQEMETLLETGNSTRTVAATLMNAQSSRSHAVCTIVLTQTKFDPEIKMSSSVESKIQLVDLAGSERADTSGATGARLAEASAINQSLSTLGRVISVLALKSKQESMVSPKRAASLAASGKESDPLFVPFRDSVLTWLLKESLGGNAKTIMIACVSPADMNFEESLSTLRYASAAKNIKNMAIKNEDPNGELIRKLRAEIDALRLQLTSNTTVTTRTVVEVDPEAAAMVEKLRAQLLANAQSMAEMERVWSEKLAQMNRVAQQRLEELQQQGASLVQAQAQLQREQAQAAQAAAAAEAAAAEAAAAAAQSAMASAAALAAASAAVNDDLTAPPFLLNLNERVQMGESLFITLQLGTTTVVKAGSLPPLPDSSSSPPLSMQHFSLRGPDVRDRHAQFVLDASSGSVTLKYLAPFDSAAAAADHSSLPSDLFVNGASVFGSKLLTHGDRIAIGSTSIFRFSRSHTELQRARGEVANNSGTVAIAPRKKKPRGVSIHAVPKSQKTLDAAATAAAAAAAAAALVPAIIEEPVAVVPESRMSPEALAAEAAEAAALEAETAAEMAAEAAAAAAATAAAEAATAAAEAAAALPPPVDPRLRWTGWVRSDLVSSPALDALVLREMRLQPRHKQKRATAAATLSAALNYDEDQAHSLAFVLHVLYKWRLRTLRRRVSDEAIATLFLVDEANAMASALGLPERYRVELHSRLGLPFHQQDHTMQLIGGIGSNGVGVGSTGGLDGAVESRDGTETMLSMTPLQRLRSLQSLVR